MAKTQKQVVSELPPAAFHPARWRELALEGATSIAAAALWLHYSFSPLLVPASLATLLLLLIAAIDIDRRLVLNEVLLAGAVLALSYAALGGWGRLLSSLAGGVLALGLFALFASIQRGAMGAGDVKLAGLLGLMFGYPVILQVLMLGVIIGGLVAGGLLLTRRLDRKAMIPYAPFLSTGGILVLLWI